MYEKSIRTIEEYVFSKIEPAVQILNISTVFKKVKFFWKSYREALECSNNPKNHYRVKTIRKSDGIHYREIYIPDYIIKEHQKYILRTFLEDIPISKYAYAYCKGRSPKAMAEVHFNSRNKCVIKLDIENFFVNITAKKVYNVFDKVPYMKKELKIFLTNICCLDGKLPQGAPTSPALSNIIMVPIDNIISVFSMKNNIRYTRYSDDMVFSFDENKIQPDKIIKFVDYVLRSNGFRLNKKKTKMIRINKQKCSVLGININEKLQLPRGYRRKIRQEMYYIKKFGLKQHMANAKVYGSDYGIALYTKPLVPEEDELKYLEQLKGKVNYAIDINPNDLEMQNYKCLLDEMLKTKHN